MKILCVIDSLGSGGAQRQLVELGKGFKKQNHDVTFLIYHNINFFRSELEEEKIEVILVDESNFLKRILGVKKSISNLKPDVILSFLEGPNFICEVIGLLPRKWKLIVGERSANPKIYTSWKLKFYRIFHLSANQVVCNSFCNQKILTEVNPLISKSKNQVIYNLIDHKKWLPLEEKNIPSGKFRITVAASHQYLKNSIGLIEAIHGLSMDYKNKIQIDWYGDESPDNSFIEAQDLVRKYRLEDTIKFHPAAKDICSKYSIADAVGLFSFYEGFPNAICEAMMMGKVVVCSGVSDISIVLDHCSNLVFDPNHVTSIQKALKNLMRLKDQELVRIGEENRRIALNLFEKEKIVSDYLKLMIA
ncbi:glycosyl transferase [Salinimicrobium marinum]|uniref:Glycosyl transferase n=1 Tax=Salinimicrobium marinum TaxID=680283 RepID=A0A918SIL9_9FLAO|nr:glycosyltransferase [Salinimicrobium marinum]GHA46220.1 glycosyl transferase [Salinimicrobium marinum]